MGFHKKGFVAIGAYVKLELRDYIDKLTIKRGFFSRSDTIRSIIREHRAVFSYEIDRDQALTPLKVKLNGNHHGLLRKINKNEIRGKK